MDALSYFFDSQYQKSYPNTCNKNDETPLHIAARSKQANAVKRLLDAGADVNALDSYGNTPLHSAVKAKAVAVVKILLRHFAIDVNACTLQGDTPVILASSSMRRKQLLLVLINAGADVNAANNKGKTALHWAAELNYVSKLDLLLKHGANKIAQDNQRRTPLHLAALSNGANAVKRLLEAGAEVNTPDNTGRTPLHLAAEATAVAAVQVLLRHSATDLNARATKDFTPLLCASSRAARASRNQQLLAVNLINAGANVNAKDCNGWTALHFATTYDCLFLMDALLQNGANVNARDKNGRVPLHCVSNAMAVKRLLNAGADANIQDNDGYTPLHYHVEEEDPIVFQALLYHTTNLNCFTKKDSTPLITAVYMGLADMVIDLIKVGADVNASDSRGKTALHWASDFKDIPELSLEDYDKKDFFTRRAYVAAFLLASGANANAKDNFGNTPLHIAIESDASTVFEILLHHRATDLDARRTLDGKTALMILLKSEYTLEQYMLTEHGFENLINAGADIRVTDYKGMTVLHYTAKWDDAEAMEILLKHGADVNFADKAGMTALHTSVESNAWAVFEVLLMQPEIDLNVRRISDGKTPLIMMVESDPDIVDFEDILELGADVSATDNEGKTALHYAAKLDKIDEINALIASGANTDVQDRKGQTPLHLAAGTDSFDVCRLLVAEFFANRDITDNRGKLPRDIASERDHEDIVMLLNNFMPAG